MDITAECPLAGVLAERIRLARGELTMRWLDRIAARVSIDENRVFPTDDLLDHVPMLMLGVADYLENPANEIVGDIPVVAKAMELGDLRYSQGFDSYEIQKEYEIFGGILFAFLTRIVEDLTEPCSRSELLVCSHRLYRAITLIQQATMTQHLRRVSARVREREGRLRTFNRAITHELKNQIHASMGAAQVLELEGLPDDERRRLLRVVSKNLDEMRTRLEALLDLTRMESDSRTQRHVRLPQAAAEAVRQLREAAAAANVEVRLAKDLPAVEVHAAAIELSLSNYLSNAIKYADPAKSQRWVEIRGFVRYASSEGAEGPCELVVEVHDNGLGVPAETRQALFGHFVRAHAETITDVEGTGLGLSIVRETLESIGGRAWAEFPTEGSIFAFALPCRREMDAMRPGREGERGEGDSGTGSPR